jgi:hypothetical protein
LIDGSVGGGGLPETQLKHLANEVEASAPLQRKAGLPQQAIGARTLWLARCIQSHACFTNPNQQRARTRSKNDGGVSGPGTGFEHDADEAANKDVGTHPVYIDEDKRAVEHVDFLCWRSNVSAAGGDGEPPVEPRPDLGLDFTAEVASAVSTLIYLSGRRAARKID